MQMSHSQHALANLEELRQAQVRARALDIRADMFAREVDALVRTLVHTALLARVPRSLSEPATLAPCLDRMGRLANSAVRLDRQLRESGMLCQPGKRPAHSGRSRSIPVSPWEVVTFKANVRRLTFRPRTRSTSQTSLIRGTPPPKAFEFAILREGTRALVERAVETAGTLLKGNCGSGRLARGGRKAQRC